MFEKWMNGINKHSNTSGFVDPSDYQRDIMVHQLGRAPYQGRNEGRVPILRTYKMYGCFPSSIGSIPLSYDQTDTIEQYSVTFEIQWWEPLTKRGKKDLK
jgi:hypothetical protein